MVWIPRAPLGAARVQSLFSPNLSRKKPNFHLCSALIKPVIIHRFGDGKGGGGGV